jgi:alpha-L-arabinofuranosidase
VWLDGEPLFDQLIPNAMIARVYWGAGLDKAAGEIVVKGVNPHAEPVAVALTLAGAKVPAQKARRILLAGQADDVNTLENPLAVSPKEDAVEIAGPAPQLTLPPNSLTVLRIKAETGN